MNGRPTPEEQAPAPAAPSRTASSPRPVRRAPEPSGVTWDERRRRPSSFGWRRRRWRVHRVLERWVIETGWWSEATRVSRSYWRVEAEGRVLELCYDRLAKRWTLERILS